MQDVTIAIDAMGGDYPVISPILGANLALKRLPNLKFIFFGDEAKILKALDGKTKLKNASRIVHTDDDVPSNYPPADAIRKKKNSSMRLALNSVASKESSASVSAGSTGALMAMSKFVLKTLNNIDRPAIVTNFPTKSGSPITMLDLGANVDCKPNNFLEFAIMGRAYSQALSGNINPSVAILNIGSEDIKGSTLVKDSASIFLEKESVINYKGFLEGDQIFDGTVDVLVTDGFTGNVTLKTIEGTTNFFKLLIKKSFMSTPLTSFIAGVFLIPAYIKLYKMVDTKRYNGAMFIGVNGISVKSHGSANPLSFSYAIENAYKLVVGEVLTKIETQVHKIER